MIQQLVFSQLEQKQAVFTAYVSDGIPSPLMWIKEALNKQASLLIEVQLKQCQISGSKWNIK